MPLNAVMKNVPGCDCDCTDSPGCIPTQCGRVVACPGSTIPYYPQNLPDATVDLTWSGGGVSLVTDADGRYCFDNPATSGVEVTINYVVSHPDLVTATGSFIAKCLTPGTFPDIQLFPDDDHACACSCVIPYPKVLAATNSKGSGTVVLGASGAGNEWFGNVDWTESEGAASFVSVPGGNFGTCSCAVKGTVNARVWYFLDCVGGAWRCSMYSSFSQAYSVNFSSADPKWCYGPSAPSACYVNDPINWRYPGRFIANATTNTGIQANENAYGGGIPVDCSGVISLDFTFTRPGNWPLETPLTVNFSG